MGLISSLSPGQASRTSSIERSTTSAASAQNNAHQTAAATPQTAYPTTSAASAPHNLSRQPSLDAQPPKSILRKPSTTPQPQHQFQQQKQRDESLASQDGRRRNLSTDSLYAPQQSTRKKSVDKIRLRRINGAYSIERSLTRDSSQDSTVFRNSTPESNDDMEWERIEFNNYNEFANSM